ncbi:unnamed protein product [Calicophoron daubneyi]|uniref:Rap guanine nucleotide exchange factor 4 n=1 Tax=Calicophoron daubneyi TaxID=300641 RepID=A0AAV2TBB0_CALDB
MSLSIKMRLPEIISFSGKSETLDATRNSVNIPQLKFLKSTTFANSTSQEVKDGIYDFIPLAIKPIHIRTPPWIMAVCKGLWKKFKTLSNESYSGDFKSGLELVEALKKLTNKEDELLLAGAWQVLLEEGAIKPCVPKDYEQKNTERQFQFTSDSSTTYYCNCPSDDELPSPDVLALPEEKVDHFGSSASELCETESKNKRSGREQMNSVLVHMESLECEEPQSAEDKLRVLIDRLFGAASDHIFRKTLMKSPQDRTEDELNFIFQELLMIPSLAQLSSSVRFELSRCLTYSIYSNSGTVIFHQGDPGNSWYIIYRGSVWVNVEGQGQVCRLSEGDDFGKLALVTGAPRAASIITAEDNSHFLRIEKGDFDRILRDVEANTIRLREQDSDVLILERAVDERYSENEARRNSKEPPLDQEGKSVNTANHFINYTVMAGTVEKLVQHILDVRLNSLDGNIQNVVDDLGVPNDLCPNQLAQFDPIVEEFFLTFNVYAKTEVIFNVLESYLNCEKITSLKSDGRDENFIRSCDRVITFLLLWCRSLGLSAFAQLEGLKCGLDGISDLLHSKYSDMPRMETFNKLTEHEIHNRTSPVLMESSTSKHWSKSLSLRRSQCSWARLGRYRLSDGSQSPNTKLVPSLDSEFKSFCENIIEDPAYPLTRFPVIPNTLPLHSSAHSVTITVYLEHDRRVELTTVPISATALQIKAQIKKATSIPYELENLTLLEVSSKGDKVAFNDGECGVMFGISPNSCLFIAAKDRIPTLAPLPMQLTVTMNYLDQNENEKSRTGPDPQQRDTKIASPLLRRMGSCSSVPRLLEDLTVEELATVFTYAHARLAVCINSLELLDYTLGSVKTGNPSPHVKLLVSQFSLMHAWTITQIVTTNNPAKRAQVVKKLIKLADCLISPPLCNQHGCFAIVLALQSTPVTRLTHTWERVSVRWRRILSTRLTPLVDPARNHRAARNWLSHAEKPNLPFLALILKDLRFAEDANSTVYQANTGSRKLVNFEKMRLLARSLRLWNSSVAGYSFMHPEVRKVRDVISTRTPQSSISVIRRFIDIPMNAVSYLLENLECIDDVRVLIQLSHRLEPKKQ